jgi:hypothetical protein
MDFGHPSSRRGRRFIALPTKERLVPLGSDGAEGNGVDPDLITSVIYGRRSSQTLDRCLGRGIGQCAADGPLRLMARDIDDRAALADTPPAANSGCAADDGRRDVARDQVDDLVRRMSIQCRVLERCCVVDPTTQPGHGLGAIGGFLGHRRIGRVPDDTG